MKVSHRVLRRDEQEEARDRRVGLGPEDADDDVVSDPAKDAGEGGDWSDEGGATPSGPADTGDHTQ